MQKEELLQKITRAFGTDGKELYWDVQALIQWCQEECGIDFSSQDTVSETLNIMTQFRWAEV